MLYKVARFLWDMVYIFIYVPLHDILCTHQTWFSEKVTSLSVRDFMGTRSF
jgi:hypothetical protein